MPDLSFFLTVSFAISLSLPVSAAPTINLVFVRFDERNDIANLLQFQRYAGGHGRLLT